MFERGDLLLVPFPFSGLSATKPVGWVELSETHRLDSVAGPER
jgi:hypothetical protein